ECKHGCGQPLDQHYVERQFKDGRETYSAVKCPISPSDDSSSSHADDPLDIVRSLAVSLPDVTEGGETWCAVCDTELHKGWPSWDEHREDCAYKRAHNFVYAARE